METEILNLNQICRTCKSNSPQMITFGDGLPARICHTCMDQLKNAFLFKHRCKEVDSYLRDYIKNIKDKEIKQELPNSDVVESSDTASNENSTFKEPNHDNCNQTVQNEQRVVSCDVCSTTFSTASELEYHKNSHNRQKQSRGRKNIYVCKICRKKLGRKDFLRRHLVTHLKEKPFPCKTCNRVYNRLHSLKRHIYKCKRDLVYPCHVCNKAFDREISLEVHMKLHENAPKLPTIESLDNLEAYYYQIDQDASIGFSDCSAADEIDSKDIDLAGIKFEVDADLNTNCGGTSTVSSDCTKNPNLQVKVEDSSDFDDEDDTFVDEGRKGCKQEEPQFSQDVNAQKEQKNKFSCSECRQSFFRKDYLVVHMRLHKGEKPFKCKYCEKGFHRVTNLTAHEKHHTREKTHLCSICGKGFQAPYNLRLHMRTHTGERPYKCTQCNAAFAQSYDLKSHIRRHTGERYQCDLCEKTFVMGYKFTQHKRIVHGLNVVSKNRRLQSAQDEENSDDTPVKVALPKPVGPEMNDMQ